MTAQRALARFMKRKSEMLALIMRKLNARTSSQLYR